MATITRSIGTGTGAAGSGTVSTGGVSSTALVGTLTAFTTELESGGVPLTILISGTLYSIASITDATHLTLATAATVTAGTSYTRGTRNYATAQDWANLNGGSPTANLVTDGNSIVGQYFADSGIIDGGGGPVVTFTGHTTDTTHTITLTAAAGQSFVDTGSGVTLQAATSHGVTLTSSGDRVIDINDGNVFIKRLQFYSSAVNGACIWITHGGFQTITIDQCICECTGLNYVINISSSSVVAVSNCLLYGSGENAGNTNRLILGNASIFTEFDYCDICATADTGNTPPWVFEAMGTTAVNNCALFGCTAVTDGGTGYTFSHCATDVASPPTGCTGGLVYANQFRGVTAATADYRQKTSGTGLHGTGTNIGITVDIYNFTRNTSTPDIGAQELPSTFCIGSLENSVSPIALAIGYVGALASDIIQNPIKSRRRLLLPGDNQ